MKIAIVHDQLREFGGAERVLVILKKMFPSADVYTSTYDNKALGAHAEIMKRWNIQTSWFGRIPVLNAFYSPLRFLTPWIWESLDFGGYDLVISSTGSWMCKGIKTRTPTVHISYVHHPPRYLYGYETAVEWQKHALIKLYGTILNHFLRIWDFTASQRPDYFIANSMETKRRIQKFYRRNSTVIYPPVHLPDKKILLKRHNNKNGYFITVSRLARAKHVDILIKAANKYKFELKIVGTGRDEKYLRSLAKPGVEILGNVPDNKMPGLYLGAQAFLFASVDEEFGIAPVEAMGYGLPVIAFNSGGLPETVREGSNGFLYNKLTPESLYAAIEKLYALSQSGYSAMVSAARKKAESFSIKAFKHNMNTFVKKVLRSQGKKNNK